jgi:WD40 repeat protein
VLPDKGNGGAVFTPDGSLVVSATGVVWDVADRRRVGTVPASIADPVVGRRGGRAVVLETRNGSATVAVLPSGAPRTRLRGRFSSPYLVGAFSRNGSVLATEDDTRTALWDSRSGRRLGTLPGANALPSAEPFSPTGEWLLTRTGSGVRVWDVARRRPVADLPHPRPVGSAVFSPNGRLVVTASYDGLARVWEARTGRLVARLRDRRDQVWNEGFVPHARFAPDGRTVVAATGGTGVFVGDCAICAPLAGLLAQAKQATSRTLTADERHTYMDG